MTIKPKCKICGETTPVVKEYKTDTFILLQFECGHSSVVPRTEKKEENVIEAFQSLDGEKLFPFQTKGVEFALNSNARCLIADEMGLGKTMQSLVPLALNADLLPAICIVKSVGKANWGRAAMCWAKQTPQVIGATKDRIHSMFNIHVMSFDVMTRLMNSKKKRPDFDEIRKRCKTLIVDETHLIKNPSAERSRALKKLAGGEAIQNSSGDIVNSFPQVPHVIGLSGTPFKNHALEYFTILNVIKPEQFHSSDSFVRHHVRTLWNGTRWVYGGIKYPEHWKEVTKDFILRRTMDEVLPELPKLWKKPVFAELQEEVEKIYDTEEAEFAKYFDEGKGDVSYQANILARMARLRHITSLAKIDTTIDKTVEFLGSTDRKLVIFVHHHDTRDILAERLNPVLKELELGKVWVLTSKDKDEAQKRIDEFGASPDRVLILSTISHGESLNIQKVASDSILHERQWNPANEEQAISGRFRRIGQEAEHINCIIPIAIGTIDEYFAEIIEQKREYFESTMKGEEVISWDMTNIMMELANVIADKGRMKWRIA